MVFFDVFLPLIISRGRVVGAHLASEEEGVRQLAALEGLAVLSAAQQSRSLLGGAATHASINFHFFFLVFFVHSTAGNLPTATIGSVFSADRSVKDGFLTLIQSRERWWWWWGGSYLETVSCHLGSEGAWNPFGVKKKEEKKLRAL